MHTLPRRVAWLLAAAGVFLFFAWIVQDSNSFQACLAGESQRFDDAGFVRLVADDKATPSDVECLGDFLDANEPTLVALATVMVAGFTGTLWASTKKMQAATERIARSADITAQRQLRAYVSGTPEFLFPFDETHPPRLRYRVHNGGGTPANEVRHRAGVAVLSGDEVRLPPLSDSFSGSCVLFPNAEMRATGGRDTPLDQGAIAALRNGTARLYCYGEIDYIDAFMYPRSTRFCHEVCIAPETLVRLSSLDGANDPAIEFRNAPFGNTAT